MDVPQGFGQQRQGEAGQFQISCLRLSVWHFLSLLFGIVSASDIFRKATEHVTETLERITVCAEDIVQGSTLPEHNQRWTKVLQSIRKS